MSRRGIIAAISCAGALVAPGASASSGWMSGGDVSPIEQRIAVAAGPSRTVVWTSLRYRGSAPLALVVPASKGAAVDLVSDAWFEALEANTAPRILPSSQADACPGSSPDITAVEVVGDLAHRQTSAPSGVTVLANAAAVDAWAAQHHMFPSGSLDVAMRALAPSHFVVVAFPASADGGTTATVRVTSDGSNLRVPLNLTHAGVDDLLVTTFLLGPARAALVPETPGLVAPASITWFPALRASSYGALRDEVLAASSEATLTESAGHDGLVHDASIAFGFVDVDSLTRAYFERGAAYEGEGADANACLADAIEAFSHPAPVGESCPAGALATVGTVSPCDETTPNGTTPAAALRCGSSLDDLALGLAGMVPAGVWLTRESLLVEGAHPGTELALEFPGGAAVSNVLSSGRIDLTGCDDGSGSGNGNGNGNGSGHGGLDVNGSGSIDLGSLDAGGCDGSDTGGGCDGGDTGGGACDGGGGDDCDAGGGDDCSGGDAGSCDCTFGRKPRPRGSVILMTAIALAALARRRSSNRRRARRDELATKPS